MDADPIDAADGAGRVGRAHADGAAAAPAARRFMAACRRDSRATLDRRSGCDEKRPAAAGRLLRAGDGSGRRRLGLRLVALACAAGCRAAGLPSSSTSTVRRPPSTRRPNSSSSASARRIVSWIRRCIGRAPISGSKPFFARCLRSASVKVTSTFFSASWLFELQQELVDHAQDDLLVERA